MLRADVQDKLVETLDMLQKAIRLMIRPTWQEMVHDRVMEDFKKHGTMDCKINDNGIVERTVTTPSPDRDYVDSLTNPQSCADYGKSLNFQTDHNGLVLSVVDGDGNDVPMDKRVLKVMASCGLKPLTPENEQEAKENKRKEDEISAFASRCGEACARELDSVLLAALNETTAPAAAPVRSWKMWAKRDIDSDQRLMWHKNECGFDVPFTILPGHDAIERIEREAYERGKRDALAIDGVHGGIHGDS